MPRFKEFQDRQDGASEPATVFDQVMSVIQRSSRDDIVPLHLGDTHSLPPEPAQPHALDYNRWPGFGRYAQTQGIPELKTLLVDKIRTRNQLAWVGPEQIQVTCGAIHGLYASTAALLEPGEEVMVLSPHWHLTNPVIAQAGAVPRDVACYITLAEDPGCDLEALLEKNLTAKTAALYLNTPCNPTGLVVKPEVLRQIADFAMVHDLWVISDEAYEDFIYTDQEHDSIASLPGMAERTVTLFTFSKCLAAAGYRVGYVVAQEEVIQQVHHASTRTIYNAPTDNQALVAEALQRWDDWFPELFNRYKANRNLVCERFQGRYFKPEGSFYVFFDATPVLQGRAPQDLLEAMVREGVSAVPGAAFGEGFENWFRFCFVSVPEETLALGIERLNRVLGG